MSFIQRGRKVGSVLAAAFFLCQQIGWTAPEILSLKNNEQATVTVRKTVDLPEAGVEQTKLAATALDFLQQENPLKPVSDADLLSQSARAEMPVQNYEYERYSTEDALDLFRPEYAAAVILKNVSGDDLARLQKLSFETALIVLNGEIVFFTTGNEGEIGSSKPVSELLKKATFVSHVHSQGTQQEGPSSFDLNEAVAAPGVEYVVTGEGTYVYNSQGIQNGGEKISLNETAKLIEAAREADRQSVGEDQTTARSQLNQFIREMDLYNSSLIENRETFRRSLVPVSTLAELQAMKNDLEGDYYLTNDIDASDTVNWNSGAGFEPIGTGNDPFHGSFNGNGFKITNLTINRPAQDYVGLFGSLESTGTIENVKLENVSIRGRNNVGAVSGYTFVSELSNASADGGTVTGIDRVGGLVGESYNGSGINNSHSNVSVSGNDQVGGIVGKIWDGILNNINQSYVLGTVNGRNEVGGLAGYSKSGDMIRSYVTGNVTGQDYVGGLVGSTTENAGIRNSYYSGGAVSGTANNVGGIAGLYGSYDDGISNTYFAGTVTSAGTEGGFLGTYQAGTLANNFWDTTLNAGLQDTSTGDRAGITGQSTAAMQTQNNFTDWNFDTIWVMNGYPRLQQAVAVSTLKELQDMRVDLNAKYYLVNDINASATVSWNGGLGFLPVGTGNGNPGSFNANAFHGAFNGAGYKITGLTINRPTQDYVGLFGSLESAGTIENIKLENTSITGRNNVGGLTGYMFLTTVTGSSVSGQTVAGADRVGGLVGESYNGTGIKESFTNILVSGQNQVGGIVGKLWDGNLNDLNQVYSLGRVSGTNQIGGLVGYSKSGDMIRSYATGYIDGQDYVGGLVGFTTENAGIRDSYYADGHISGITNRVGGIAGLYGSYDDGIQRTYFSGQVTSAGGPGGFIGNYTAGALADNFWDSTLNPGLQDSVSPGNLTGVTAQNTALMQTQSTFTNWDFTNIWRMEGYPKFRSTVQDLIVPEGTAVINGNHVYANDPNLSVRVISSEPIQFYSYRVDGGAWSAQLSFPNLNGSHGATEDGEDLSISVSSQEGQRLVEIQLYDFAGNISEIISDTIILDTTAPAGSAVVAGGLDYTNTQTNDVAVNFTDNLAGLTDMRFKKTGDLDWGPWQPYNAAATVQLSDPDELKVVQVQVRDAARNVGTAQDPVFFDDTIPPVGTIQIENGAQYANTNTLNLQLSASDEGGSGIKDMRFSVDGGMTWSSWTAFSSSYALNVTSVPDGPLTVFYQVRDNCNNVREVTPPTVGISLAPPNFIVNVQDPPGALSYDVLFRANALSTSWTVLQHDVPVSGTGNSSYNVGPPQSPSGIYAVRVARNQGGSFSDQIILDRVIPSGAIQLITVGDRSLGQAYNKARIQLSGLMDLVSGIQQIRYRVGGGAWADLPLPSGQTLTADVALPEFWGTKSLEIQIIDRAANIRNLSQNITIAVEEYVKDVEMRYLSPSTIDAASAYPHEGYYQQGYTQPSHIGFYAQLLANVISGEIVTDKLTPAAARVQLQTLINSLRVDQLTLGKFGLLPWMKFNGTSRLPANGDYGQQVVFIDNSNLAASLGAASGALRALAAQTDINQIITDIESFLDRQAEGYQKIYDSTRGLFRSGCFITGGTACSPIGGYQDVIGNEARGGVQFVLLRYNFKNISDGSPDNRAFLNQQVYFKPYVKADGTGLAVSAPYNGSAFQMLWPLLTMPETLNSGLNDMLADFVDAALDHSERNGLPGLASAGWEVCAAGDTNPDCALRGTKYNGNLGIPSLAVGAGSYNDKVGSLYMLGAAYMLNPARVKARLEAIMTQYETGLITSHGLWEGYDQEQHAVVQEQVGANVFTLVLGLIGKGPDHMTAYLKWKDAGTPTGDPDYYTRLKNFYTNASMNILTQSNALCFESNSAAFGCPNSWSKPYSVNVPNYSYFTVYFIRNSPAVFEVGGEKLTLKYTSNIDLSNVTFEFKTGPGAPVISIPGVKLKATAPATPTAPKEIKEISFGLPQDAIFNGIHEITIKAVGGGGNQALAFSVEGFDLSGSSVPSPRPGQTPLEVPTAFVEINNGDAYTTSRQVTVKLDPSKNVELMRISLDGGVTWMDWEPVRNEFGLTLPQGAGFKEVKAQVKDSFGQYSDLFSDKILYDVAGFLSGAELEPSVVPVVRQVLKQMLSAAQARISNLNSRIKKAKTKADRKDLEKQLADWVKIQNQINRLDQDLIDQETVIAKTGTVRAAILSRVLTQTISIFGLLY